MRGRTLFGTRSTRVERHCSWGIDGLSASTLESLERMLERIGDLSCEQWRQIGRRAAEHYDERSPARVRLDAAIVDGQLELLRWFVRDTIDAAAQQVILAHGVQDRGACTAIRAAREPLQCAAMAIALRDRLDGTAYDALFAEFCTSIAT